MKVLDWNGRDLPEALKALPPGRYVLQPVEELVQLDAADEQGIREALAQLERGEGLEHLHVLAEARRALRR